MTPPDSKEDEIKSLNKQVNTPNRVVDDTTLEQIVEFARRTRQDDNEDWPTISPRNIKIVCEDIGDGVRPGDAIYSMLEWLAGRHIQDGKEEAQNTLTTMFDVTIEDST